MKGGDHSDLRTEDHQRLTEYNYRVLFNVSHEQYMNEPMDSIDWMLRIDEVHRQIEKDQAGPAT